MGFNSGFKGLTQKNNHGSSHNCSRKYSFRMISIQN